MRTRNIVFNEKIRKKYVVDTPAYLELYTNN